jgi:hypothetical protein
MIIWRYTTKAQRAVSLGRISGNEEEVEKEEEKREDPTNGGSSSFVGLMSF